MSTKSSYLTTDVKISMSDLVYRDLTEDFVNDVFKKFTDINDHVGITSREYHFPKVEICSAIRQHFSEIDFPQSIICNAILSIDLNRIEILAKPAGTDYKSVKIFYGEFLK